jgi:DNA-binding Xre family transcriptional regulator
MTTQKAVALRVSNLLVKNHLTQYALCKKIAMPEETLRSIIDERYKTVKLDTIILICDGFDISLQEFFNDDLFKRENLEVE